MPNKSISESKGLGLGSTIDGVEKSSAKAMDRLSRRVPGDSCVAWLPLRGFRQGPGPSRPLHGVIGVVLNAATAV